jgi:hypothetical protein
MYRNLTNINVLLTAACALVQLWRRLEYRCRQAGTTPIKLQFPGCFRPQFSNQSRTYSRYFHIPEPGRRSRLARLPAAAACAFGT